MKFRILSNGNLFRAQVRTFLVWWDLDDNGYRTSFLERHFHCYRFSAASAIKKFLATRDYTQYRGPWVEADSQGEAE